VFLHYLGKDEYFCKNVKIGLENEKRFVYLKPVSVGHYKYSSAYLYRFRVI